MISVNKHIKISIFTVIAFVVVYILGFVVEFIISYSSMVIHECFHLISAIIIGLKPDYISLLPFGVSLKLKNKFTSSVLDDILLYLSGPFSNLIIALIFCTVFQTFKYSRYIYLSNLALFLINILPIAPLDGGNILKRLLYFKFGKRKGNIILKAITFVFSTILFILGIIVVRKNYSLILIAFLSFANLFCDSEKYEINTILSTKNKNVKKIRLIRMDNTKDFLNEIRESSYIIGVSINDDGKIDKIFTEDEIISQFFLDKNEN